MINIDKRHCFWRLNLLAERFQQRIDATKRDPSNFPIGEFLFLCESLGVDPKSAALHEVLRLAAVTDREALDTHVLFHVIREAVAKIRERNLSFWLTVMTVTGASISWVDFRRKLSKWMSTNGLSIAQSKNIIAFVQQNVDPQSTGLVKKDVFLRLADDLMGYDCLLSPESIIKLGQSRDVRENVLTRGIGSSSEQSRMSPVEYISPDKRSTTLIHQAGKLKESQADPGRHQVCTRIQGSHESMALVNIRRKLGFSSLEKVLETKLRVFFVIFRISSAPTSHHARQRAVAGPYKSNSGSLKSFTMLMKLLHQRVVAHALSRLLTYSSSTEKQGLLEPTRPPQGTADENHGGDEGPSWTVTIQAVAIANLFGILRTCLVRATMPGFFSLKSGHCVDDYNPIRKVLWAQSSQGKKDAQIASGKSRGVLQPIHENITTNQMRPEHAKENLSNSVVEFDLSI